MKKPELKTLIKPLLDLLLPERCRVCDEVLGQTGGSICGNCLREVRYMDECSLCVCCGTVIMSSYGKGKICGDCLKKSPDWDRTISVVEYSHPVTRLLHRLKYQADTTVVPALAQIVEPHLRNQSIQCDLVLPVPLHKRRLQRRGLNQSIYIAKLLFPRQENLIQKTVLRRIRDTASQTGLDGKQRRKNLSGAFTLVDTDWVKGKKVCLVDDVLTTGTTVAECSKVLRRGGAKEITVCTLARVVKKS